MDKNIIIKTIILIVLFLAVIMFAMGTFIIFRSVYETCNFARDKYGGDCQQALVLVLEDGESSVQEKNDAIWALGQMADPESLEPLEKIYAGKVPEGKEPLDKVVSQYEIEKAIRWIKNGNLTSWMYVFIKN